MDEIEWMVARHKTSRKGAQDESQERQGFDIAKIQANCTDKEENTLFGTFYKVDII